MSAGNARIRTDNARVHLFARRGDSIEGRHSRESRNPVSYQDIPGFCKSAALDDIRKHNHVLTPGRYVGAEATEDDGEPFEDKMKRLTATLRQQQKEGCPES